MTQYLTDGEQGDPIFIFAHGAGAGMDHPFMATIATKLAQQGIRVVRFNFPYMVKRAEDGKKRPPDRAPKLLDAFNEVIAQFAVDGPVFIGGKSMGGRMASLLADNPAVAGIACLGFPFHPPGKPENYKGEHLATMSKPLLLLQGERDVFGRKEEFADFTLSPAIEVHFIADGDHSFKPRVRSGYTEVDNLTQAAGYLAEFIHGVCDEK